MPKMKTHSGAKKRFKVTATGKVRGRHAFTSHILEKKSPKHKRAAGQADDALERRRAPRQADAGSGQMTRVKRSVGRAQEAPRDARADEGLPRRGALQLQARQGGAAEGRRLRLPRPAQPQARLPQAVDHAHQRRRARQRHELLAVHARPVARRHRARPQGARRHRRARRRHVPTFCRGRPRGVGCLTPIAGHRRRQHSLPGVAPERDGALFVCRTPTPPHTRPTSPRPQMSQIASPQNPRLKAVRRLHTRRERARTRLVPRRGRGSARGRRAARAGARSRATAWRDPGSEARTSTTSSARRWRACPRSARARA